MRYLPIHYNEMSYMYVICLVFTTIAFLKRQTDDPSFSESRLKSFIINPISKQNFPRIRPWTFWSCTFFFFLNDSTYFVEGGFYFFRVDRYVYQTKITIIAAHKKNPMTQWIRSCHLLKENSHFHILEIYKKKKFYRERSSRILNLDCINAV